MWKILIKFEFSWIGSLIRLLLFILFLLTDCHHNWLFLLLLLYLLFLWLFFCWSCKTWWLRFLLQLFYLFVELNIFIWIFILSNKSHLCPWFSGWLFWRGFRFWKSFDNSNKIFSFFLFDLRLFYFRLFDLIVWTTYDSSHDRWCYIINLLILLYFRLEIVYDW